MSVCPQAAPGRVATPCGRSNGAVAPLRVSWAVGAAARPATRAQRASRRAAQRLGSHSDASTCEMKIILSFSTLELGLLSVLLICKTEEKKIVGLQLPEPA